MTNLSLLTLAAEVLLLIPPFIIRHALLFHNKADNCIQQIIFQNYKMQRFFFFHNGNVKSKTNDRSDINPAYMKLFMFIFVIWPVWAIINPLKD